MIGRDMFMKKKILIALLIIVIIGIGSAIAYYFMSSSQIKCEAQSIRIDYQELPITTEDVDAINNQENWTDDIYFTYLGKKLESKDGKYGNLFEVTYRISFTRRFGQNDCKVDADAILGEELSKHIFGIHVKEKPFEEQYDDGTYDCTVSIVGATLGESTQKLNEMLKQSGIKLYMKDQKGKITERTLKFNKADFSYDTLTKKEVEESGQTFLDSIKKK